jgi:hypothetical protein
MKVELDTDSINDTDPAYSMDSPLWARWFEAKHEERRAGIEAHLLDLDNENVD